MVESTLTSYTIAPAASASACNAVRSAPTPPPAASAGTTRRPSAKSLPGRDIPPRVPARIRHLICTPVCQGRRARRRPGPSSWAPPLWARSIWVGGERVRFDAWSTLIFAGRVPQDSCSAGVGRWSNVERDPNVQLEIDHRSLADHSLALPSSPHDSSGRCGGFPFRSLRNGRRRRGGQRWSPRSAARRTDLAARRVDDHTRNRGRGTGTPRSGIQHGQRPTPAGQFAGDRGIRQCRAFVADVEPGPAGVQASVCLLSAGPSRGTGIVPAAPQLHSGAIRGSVVPGGLDRSRRA